MNPQLSLVYAETRHQELLEQSARLVELGEAG